MSKRIPLLCALLFMLVAGSAFAADQPKGPFATAVHVVGTFSDKSGNPISVTWDRGQITSLSSSSITLTRADKQQVSFAITSDTTVRNNGATYTLDDLKTGLVATVASQDGNAVVIRDIRGPGAPHGGQPSPFAGPAAKAITGSVDVQYVDGSQQSYDFTRGGIRSAANGSLTIMRPDKQSVTLTYDATAVVWIDGHRVTADHLRPGERGTFLSQNGALSLARCFVRIATPQDSGQGQTSLSASAALSIAS